MFNSLTTKTFATAGAVAMVTLMTASFTTEAQAGKRGFYGKHFKNPYLLKHQYVCKPRFIKAWVWDKRKGRKVRRLIRVKNRCNVRYK